MRVFRVQNAEGKGPYGSDALLKFPELFQGNHFHPDPQDDYRMEEWTMMPDSLRRRFYFCFASVIDARAWFYETEWREALAADGQTITEWEVEDEEVILGDRQGVFLRELAEMVAQHPVIPD